VGSEQCAVGSEQCAVGSEQCAVGSEQWAVIRLLFISAAGFSRRRDS